MVKHARPAPVHNVTITLDGVTHSGTYYVQDSVVYVQCDAGKKTTKVGGLPARSLAKLLLSELVREQRIGATPNRSGRRPGTIRRLVELGLKAKST